MDMLVDGDDARVEHARGRIDFPAHHQAMELTEAAGPPVKVLGDLPDRLVDMPMAFGHFRAARRRLQRQRAARHVDDIRVRAFAPQVQRAHDPRARLLGAGDHFLEPAGADDDVIVDEHRIGRGQPRDDLGAPFVGLLAVRDRNEADRAALDVRFQCAADLVRHARVEHPQRMFAAGVANDAFDRVGGEAPALAKADDDGDPRRLRCAACRRALPRFPVPA